MASLSFIIISFVFIFDSFLTIAEGSLKCRVKVGNSVLHGRHRQTDKNVEYCSFFDIPYSEHKRFELSKIKNISWTGVKKFTSTRKKCFQYDYSKEKIVGQEDCLHIDVLASLKDEHSPVLVWIHGGTFNFGSGQKDISQSDEYIEKGIIIVTVSYRLGPLGFLSASHLNIPKNLGFKDQVIALQWIQRYISYFGGNKSDITLAGFSAGSAAVTYHLYANISQGLFHKAIAMSGTFLNPWAFNRQSEICSTTWCNNFDINCNLNNSSDLLKNMSIRKIPSFEHDFTFLFFSIYFPCFLPTLEEKNLYENIFIQHEPHELIETKPINDVPLLIGYTSLEEMCDIAFPNKYLMSNVAFPHDKDYVHLFLEEFLEQQTQETFLKLHRFADTIYGIRNFVEHYVKKSRNRIYVYKFSVSRKITRKEMGKCVSKFEKGAFHGDDVKMLFGTNQQMMKTFGRSLSNQKEDITELWTNFIRFGNPTPQTVLPFRIPHWPNYRTEKLIININETMNVEHEEQTDLFMFWNSVHNCIYKNDCDPFDKMVSKFNENTKTSNLHYFSD